MAFHILLIALTFHIFYGLELHNDMDEALFTDAVAEDCLPERSQASALSLMQKSAVVRQRGRNRHANDTQGVPKASALSLMQRSAVMRQRGRNRHANSTQGASPILENLPMSLLQMESETGFESDTTNEAESQPEQTADAHESLDSADGKAQAPSDFMSSFAEDIDIQSEASEASPTHDGYRSPDSAKAESQQANTQEFETPDSNSDGVSPPEDTSEQSEVEKVEENQDGLQKHSETPDLNTDKVSSSRDGSANSEDETAEESHGNSHDSSDSEVTTQDQLASAKKDSEMPDPDNVPESKEAQSSSKAKQSAGIFNAMSNMYHEMMHSGASIANDALSKHLVKFYWIALSCVIVGALIYSLQGALSIKFVNSGKCTQSSHAERDHVVSLPVCTAPMIEELLPSSAGYDCIFSKPLSSRQAVRLEGRIEMPPDGGHTLRSPLKRQECIKFSSAVYSQEKDGMRPHPIAVYSASVPFVISLVDAPHVKVSVQGEDVSTFDMRGGYHSRKESFLSADQHCKDFVLDCHVGSCQPMHGLQSSEELLEFRESSILLGSVVTLSGELLRDSSGRLHLQPWNPQADAIPELGRTLAELDDCKDAASVFGKVLISDDPSLQTRTLLQRMWCRVPSIRTLLRPLFLRK